MQSADRTGWFLSRDPSSIADEVEIQSMSSYILEVEPSPLISELTQDSLYRLLPPATDHPHQHSLPPPLRSQSTASPQETKAASASFTDLTPDWGAANYTLMRSAHLSGRVDLRHDETRCSS